MRNGRIPRKLAFNLISIATASIVFLSLAEITLRVYNHLHPLFIFYTDSYDRFRGKPYADHWNFKLNSRGFKDREFTIKKENAYRILGIGDSRFSVPFTPKPPTT